jgi:UDP-N-acetylenolpyruvoylglucosamine reductase
VSLQRSQENEIEDVSDTSHEVGLEINAKMIKRMFMSYHYRDSLIKKKLQIAITNIVFGLTTHKDGEGLIQIHVSEKSNS